MLHQIEDTVEIISDSCSHCIPIGSRVKILSYYDTMRGPGYKVKHPTRNNMPYILEADCKSIYEYLPSGKRIG